MPIRIMPCLDIKDGRVVKGVQFVDLVDAGDPFEIAQAYNEEGADELVLLDIKASAESRKAMLALIEKIVGKVQIPLIVGGGINELEDFQDLLEAGVDRVVVGSAAVRSPQLIRQAALQFGSEYVMVALDAKRRYKGVWDVYIHGGRTNTQKDAVSWALELQKLGAGEILLTSMDGDGTKEGYDTELLKVITDKVEIPVIASGGAGKKEHFYDAVANGGASALLAASLFHYKELEISDLKDYLEDRGIKVCRKDS